MRIYGFHAVREVLRHEPQRVRRLWRAAGRDDRRCRQIGELCRRLEIDVESVPSEELDRLAEGVHNGFVAEVDAPAVAAAEGDAASPPSLVVLVEDVQDPRNLGALARVCDATGVGRLLVRDRGAAQLTEAAVKTSAGAAAWLPVERVTNTAREIERLKADGYWVYGAAAEGEPPWELDLTGRVAILVGGEEKGLRRLTRERCDALIGLPMLGRVESLNLATAAAAILYEVVRQRRSPG